MNTLDQLDQLNRAYCVLHGKITAEQLRQLDEDAATAARERDIIDAMKRKRVEDMERYLTEPEPAIGEGRGTLYHCPRFRGDRMSEE